MEAVGRAGRRATRARFPTGRSARALYRVRGCARRGSIESATILCVVAPSRLTAPLSRSPRPRDTAISPA
jgi:hypothetical protein